MEQHSITEKPSCMFRISSSSVYPFCSTLLLHQHPWVDPHASCSIRKLLHTRVAPHVSLPWVAHVLITRHTHEFVTLHMIWSVVPCVYIFRGKKKHLNRSIIQSKVVLFRNWAEWFESWLNNLQEHTSKVVLQARPKQYQHRLDTENDPWWQFAKNLNAKICQNWFTHWPVMIYSPLVMVMLYKLLGYPN